MENRLQAARRILGSNAPTMNDCRAALNFVIAYLEEQASKAEGLQSWISSAPTPGTAPKPSESWPANLQGELVLYLQQATEDYFKSQEYTPPELAGTWTDSLTLVLTLKWPGKSTETLDIHGSPGPSAASGDEIERRRQQDSSVAAGVSFGRATAYAMPPWEEATEENSLEGEPKP